MCLKGVISAVILTSIKDIKAQIFMYVCCTKNLFGLTRAPVAVSANFAIVGGDMLPPPSNSKTNGVRKVR